MKDSTCFTEKMSKQGVSFSRCTQSVDQLTTTLDMVDNVRLVATSATGNIFEGDTMC